MESLFLVAKKTNFNEFSTLKLLIDSPRQQTSFLVNHKYTLNLWLDFNSYIII